MTQHTNDPRGNEAPRPQDAIPIDDAGRHPAEPEKELPAAREGEQAEDLKGLAGLAPSTASGAADEKPRAPRRPRRASSSKRVDEPSEGTRPESAQPEVIAAGDGDDLHDLEVRGFTPDEARRLIDITARLNQSSEAREAEATRRRLAFTRWLVDHGRLDEWSA